MFKDGSISTHFSSLASGWINALEVLVSYCQYHKTKLLIVPQLTILDKKRLSSLEMQFISSSPRYFEIFSAYKARYWKLIKQYLELFEFPDAISILDKSDQIFTDQVHLTELGYFNLSKYLCSLTWREIWLLVFLFLPRFCYRYCRKWNPYFLPTRRTNI